MMFPTPAQDPNPDVLVLGIGNPMMGDDGVGIRVVELLADRQLPSNVSVQTIGLPGWGLPSWFEGHKNVILVDAVQMGEKPGTWKRFVPEQLQMELEVGSLSLHSSDLACGLALSQALNLLPDHLLIYGIEPEDLSIGAPLSPAVVAILPDVIDSIRLEMEKIKI